MKLMRISMGLGAALLIALASFKLGNATLAYTKSVLSNPLLERAFQKSILTGKAHKAWPWADHVVTAQLVFEETGDTHIILGGNGLRAMAFAPISYKQGLSTILVAHRDTHFKTLETVELGDALRIKSVEGGEKRYRIKAHWVADAGELYLPEGGRADGLLLITCYPFNAATAGGPLRYLVWAEREALSDEKA